MTADALRDPAESETPRLSHLLVVQPYFGPRATLERMLDERADTWLGPRVEDGSVRRGRRHLIDLRLRMGAEPGRSTFKKAAYVDLGRPQPLPDDDGFEVEVSWRAATLAPLFPVFSGRLVLRDGELRLEGWYAPPGGAIGAIADRALLQIAARGTGRWLLDELLDAADRFG